MVLPASPTSGAVLDTSSNAPNERPFRSNVISPEVKTAAILWATSTSFYSSIVKILSQLPAIGQTFLLNCKIQTIVQLD